MPFENLLRKKQLDSALDGIETISTSSGTLPGLFVKGSLKFKSIYFAIIISVTIDIELNLVNC